MPSTAVDISAQPPPVHVVCWIEYRSRNEPEFSWAAVRQLFGTLSVTSALVVERVTGTVQSVFASAASRTSTCWFCIDDWLPVSTCTMRSCVVRPVALPGICCAAGIT